jgi:hypothetical protein
VIYLLSMGSMDGLKPRLLERVRYAPRKPVKRVRSGETSEESLYVVNQQVQPLHCREVAAAVALRPP